MLRMKIAHAWRRLLELHRRILQPSHVTTVRPGCIQVKLGGFMMVSSLPAGPASTSLEHHNGIEIDEVRSKPFRCLFSFFFYLHEHFDCLKTPILTRCLTLLPFACVSKTVCSMILSIRTSTFQQCTMQWYLAASFFLSHLKWDEVSLSRVRRFATSAESGRLLAFRRFCEFLL